MMLPVLLLLVAAGDDTVMRVGKGVSAPHVLKKVDPKYTPEAERERIQGTALYTLVVDSNGRPKDIELLSPIGYGLDERGIDAIQQWRFAPGMKDGAPVNIRAQIEVNFRFPGIAFDEKHEKFRTEYNAAIHHLAQPESKAKGVTAIQELAAKKFPPAMALLGQWMRAGTEVPKDSDGGLDLIRRAADQSDRDGLYALGKLYASGDGVPADAAKSLKLWRDASMVGSDNARIALAAKYLAGDGVPADPERARYYYRLCAAHGVGFCQMQMGVLLTARDKVAALAWLSLAADNSVPGAEKQRDALLKDLSDEEHVAAGKLKGQLVRR